MKRGLIKLALTLALLLALFHLLVPVTVSGFGVREVACVFFYSLVGVPSEVAVGVSLLNYLLVIGARALLGGLLLLFDRGRQIAGRPG
ncbi:hypothetical protein SAMN05216315_13531 [Nitrosospira sp. Nsp18]|uniref:hypothetical protein n=1 Tax=Nitrosospira sp. Nsp18 TaxID=1855334 RepID=UPI000885901A|nr:hypothetical protein [Nitrosospira sp. Nsp18]SDA27911.1 hypothetical protein SAMN05216315_13531 [Nitrosospira sp. Nsp18]